LVPRLLQLNYFLMVDENLWYQRSANFLQALVHGQLAQTAQTGHPGVTTMWSGSIGLAWYYLQAALPGESLLQFADRMVTAPATLDTLQLLRFPLAVLSALMVAMAFGLGRWLIGTGPAALGAILMAFEPLFLAHSRVLHHDSPTADFSLLAVLSWLLYLKDRRRGYLLLAGAGVALATLSKVSSVFLLGFAGLTLLPGLWQARHDVWRGLRAAAIPWFQLAGVAILVALLAWPALWAAPANTLGIVLGFVDSESGAHANGTFFMGQPVPDAGPLYYPVSLGFVLSPFTLLGLGAALVSIGLAWRRAGQVSTPAGAGLAQGRERTANTRHRITEALNKPLKALRILQRDQPYQCISDSMARRSSDSATPLPAGGRWAMWLLVYSVLFIAFMSVIGKKQERYVLPAVVVFDLLAGWGWLAVKWQIENDKWQRAKGESQIANDKLQWVNARWHVAAWGLPVLLAAGQLALVWPSAPYYSTFFDPLLGGGAQAQQTILVGRGEGMDQAARYIQAHAGKPVRRVASWYGTTVAVLFDGQTEVGDIAHPQYILNSDYIIFYINQLQRMLPETGIMRYVRRQAPLYTVRLGGIDYAYVYQGKAISHPVDPYVDQNYLAGKARLAGYEVSGTLNAGAQLPLRLFWVNDGMQTGDRFYLRLADDLEQEWGRGECVADPSFGEAATWQHEDIIESGCQLRLYPGTPPGDYRLRVGIQAADGVLIGQMNLTPQEGTLAVARPAGYPAAEQVPVERRLAVLLNSMLRLIGYDYTPAVHKPGERIPLTLYWQALDAPLPDYTIRLTLQAEGPGKQLEWAGRPVNGHYPTLEWQAGEVVRDPWVLALPNSLPGGDYQLAATLADAGGDPAGRVSLATLSVAGREHAFGLAQPPAIAQPAELGDGIRLLGYDLTDNASGKPLASGDLSHVSDITVTLTWQAWATPSHNYVVFVQLLDAADRVRAQHDGQPGDAALITSTWAAGEYVRDNHRLALPPDLPAGDYRLIAGMYLPDSGARLPVRDRAGQPGGDHVTLATPLRVP
jgi:hypothetical protein